MPRIGLTPERLAEAAGALADEIGFRSVTLTELARRFDMKVASLYSHVKNSEDLMARVALLALDRLADRAEQALVGRSGKDALIAMANVHRAFAREHPGLFEAARHRLEGPFTDDNGGIRISRATRAVLRGYALDDVECTHAMRLMGSVFLGFPMLELSGSFDHSQPAIDTSWDRAIDALDAVLKGWQRPSI
ncbi:TetR family transcriptional regulator [Pseudoduganella flava]|uniref:TetR family transcriptional regulator n=1 Tax=Pseudoduganella flava TaxID=871742 RepID=A0A562Q3S8_9BURK|nr:TetR/AcrR family transcriptional regulator [Pseudoduganella flava]QGZ41420.1 TetR family transcriptional regulator [Pseudoduganella flava]TWI51374.1 TetR family transcriptional regulator [Pseudoduganella flava]